MLEALDIVKPVFGDQVNRFFDGSHFWLAFFGLASPEV
jgi:hypothetical protein